MFLLFKFLPTSHCCAVGTDIECLLSVQGTLRFWGYPQGQNHYTDQKDTSSFHDRNVCIKANSLPGFGLPSSQAQMLFLPICFAGTITCVFPIPYCSESPYLTPVEVWLLQFTFLFPCVLHFPSYEVRLSNPSQCFFYPKAK